MIELLDAGEKDEFNGIMAQVDADPAMAERRIAFRARPYGITRPVRRVHRGRASTTLRDVVGQISTPLLITDPQDEQFWPGQSEQLFDLLPGPKEIRRSPGRTAPTCTASRWAGS